MAELVNDGGQGVKLINSGTIDRYYFLWGDRECRYLGSRYLSPVIPAGRLAELPPKRLAQARTPKIVIAGMTLRLECNADVYGEFLAGKSPSIVLPSPPVDLRFLLGILNSKVVDYFYSTVRW